MEPVKTINVVGAIVVDDHGVILSFDAGSERLFGFTEAEVVGKGFATLLAQSFRAEQEDTLLHVTAHASGKGQEVIGQRKDGATFPLWFSVNPISFDAQRLLICTAIDLSPQKAVAADLVASIEINRAILDTAVNPIITIDASGSIRLFNPGAERLFGYSRDEVEGRNVSLLMPEPYQAEHDSYVTRYIQHGEAKIIGKGREVKGRKKDGSVFPLHLSVGAMELAGERMFVGIIADGTLEAKLRDAKEAAEAGARAKEMFIANTSHELRTPMTAIIGFAEVMLQDKDASPRTVQHARIILDSARALLRIINDVLDISKIEQGKFTLEAIEFHLPTMLRDALYLLDQQATEKGLRLTVDIDGGLPPYILGDPTRLRQVLLNLVGNAVKFTETGGIAVSVRPGDKADHLHFSVKDSGIGMTAEQMSKVFLPFFQAETSTTRRFGGTGLGTAIAKQIVELMGGSIWIESAPGHGTTFHFAVELPAAAVSDVHVLSDARSGNEDYVSPRPFKVLLVDDTEINVILASYRLEQQGHQVDCRANGLEAVAAYRTGDYDLILMDVMMPEMDGLTATREIRKLEQDRRVPIIALTASVTSDERNKCYAAGMDQVQAKPIDFDELFATMEKVVAR